MDKRIYEANQVAELLKHPGMEIIRQRIAEQRSQLFHQWWRGNALEMGQARDQARGVEAFFNFVKLILLQGKVAQKEMSDNSSPGRDKEN